MLENWVQRQDDLIKEIDDKLSVFDKNGAIATDNKKIKTIQENVNKLEEELRLSKNFKKNNLKPNEIGSTVKTTVKCDQCRKTFPRACDLEEHLEFHSKAKEYSCTTCGKEFYLKWRLDKHVKVHSDQVQFCHFFNNGKLCPYDEIGCMFRHEESEQCRTRICSRTSKQTRSKE